VCAYKVSKGSGQKKITKTPQKHPKTHSKMPKNRIPASETP
jgi:hypothetical protein